jgi:shikimate dehydrogenase
MIKACVIGWPIAHSRSPLIHNYWIKHHGLSGNYDKKPVEPESLRTFFESLKQGDVAGCNVTIPHKETALAFMDHADERVRRIGALNTVWRVDGKLHATSTDGPGFVANVRDHCPAFQFKGATATVLGAGGSARAIVDELLRCGVTHIAILNRTTARAQQLSAHFGSGVRAVEVPQLSQVLQSTDLLINTTPQGLTTENRIEIPWDQLKTTAVVADIVYTPLVTSFLKAAQQRGHDIVPGLGMLLHQAVIGFEKWFGVTPKVAPELYAMVAKDIDPDYAP